MATFPAIAPNKIGSIKFPDYNVREFSADDGSTQTIQTQFSGVGAELSLEYTINQSNLATFMNFWATVGGRSKTFTLPNVIIQHPQIVVTALANWGDTLNWRFINAPSVAPVVANEQRGWYEVTFEMRSEIE